MLTLREHGTAGPRVVVVHGGPGAPGSAAGLARALGTGFQVLEPLQRRSGGAPLTVERHVEDLDEVVATRCGSGPCAVVGHSWGAMLALAWAAAHPGRAAAIALVGCGTFDAAARERMHAILAERMDEATQARLDDLPNAIADPDERLRAAGDLLLPLYGHDLAERRLEVEECDALGHRESWDDMLRLQSRGVYPAAFAAIREPVLMLHGSADPHPGALIRASLEPHVPGLEYREIERCGHYPWIEREAREPFLEVLTGWLARRLSPS